MVLDLSAGGVRLLANRKLKGVKTIYFNTGDGPSLGVKCRIVWCSKIGFRSYLVGVQFQDLPLSAAKRLLTQAATSVSPKKLSRYDLSRRLGPLLLAAGLILTGGFGEFAEKSGWTQHPDLPESIGLYTGLTSMVLLAMGLVTLVYAILSKLISLIPSSARRQVAQISDVGLERRDPRIMLNSILESALGGVLILESVRDENGQIEDFTIQTINPAAEQLLGRSAEELVARRLKMTLPCLAAEGLYAKAVSAVETGLPHEEQQKLRHDNRWYRYTAVKLGDGLAVTFADVSEQRNNEDKLRHAAYHDSLTGLPNRKLLNEHLVQAINRAERVDNYKYAVLFLDFDRFKIINDSLGHEAGDQLLLGITERLKNNLRDLDTSARLGDGHLPSRLGGDEFVILLEGIRDDRSAAVVAQRLLDTFNEPHMISGQEVTSTASIGIVVGNPGYTKPDEILRDADTAMYNAKMTGKAKYVLFDEKMHLAIADRLTTEKELRHTVETNGFEAVYEPIVCLKSGRLRGMEALIRWPHPRRGEVPPNEFIGLAEELGLIAPIGRWILREACHTFVRWHRDHADIAPEFINVNVSRGQLRDPGLIGHINAIMAESGIEPGRLRLEITESMVMDDLDQMSLVLDQLKELGVGLAMDDFGTGHSSLTCLHRFPLDVLKIDRSFINSAGRKERHYGAILHSVVELARNLDMAVVAEGIENPNQLALLQGLDCQYGQGYLFSKPVYAEDAETLMTQKFTSAHAA